MLHIDPRDAAPIWKQIEEGVRRLVGRGALRAGMAVPSVRDLARELQVNSMTVSKAYQRLTEDGMLEVRRGEGTFVASGPPRQSRADRLRTLREAALRYAAAAASLGLGREDAERELEAAWEKTPGGRP